MMRLSAIQIRLKMLWVLSRVGNMVGILTLEWGIAWPMAA